MLLAVLGIALADLGDPQEAEQMLYKALEIDEKLGRLEEMSRHYGNLGLVLFDRGELDAAEEMHRKGLDIDEKLGRLEGMASHYGNLGLVLSVVVAITTGQRTCTVRPWRSMRGLVGLRWPTAIAVSASY